MAQNYQNRPLTPEEKLTLCSLADPHAPSPPIYKILACDFKILIDAIGHHGIEPVALRKLKALNSDIHEDISNFIDQASQRQLVANVMSMTLENYARDIFSGIAETGANAAIVKGPVFATHLYPYLSDRPFTDIDILSPASHLAAIGKLLKNLGFRQAKREFFDRSQANMEQKWIRDDNVNILIELHTNLVHYPNLRKRLSFGHKQYQLASHEGRYPGAANFIVAVVHAAAGHKFHKLQLLVDVLQAFRKLEPGDIGSLEQTLEKIPARLEVLICLDLIQDLFEDVETLETSRQLAGKSRFDLPRKLINADLVLDTFFDSGHKSRLRRHGFRFIQNWSSR
jgi:hypothetical protein